MSNARRILLRPEARDESSIRNNLTALRYAVMLQVCTHLLLLFVFREYDFDLGTGFACGSQTFTWLWPVTDVLQLQILGLKCSRVLCLRVNSDMQDRSFCCVITG